MDKIEQAAEVAKAEQITAGCTAKSALEAFWAGSATASVARHVRRGAVRTINAR